MNFDAANPMDLPEFRLLQWDRNRYDYIFTVELMKEPDFCIHCFYDTTIPGNKPLTKHGIKDREVWDLDKNDRRTKLIIKHRRYKCPECGATFYELINSVPTNGKITKRLYKSIQIKGLKYPFTEVAERYGISNMTVRRAVDDFIEEHDKDRRVVAPRVIGIDEAHLNDVMRGVITDIENRQLIDILEDNKKKNIKKYIKSLEGYKNIEVATMDMATGYRYAMQELVPGCLCVIDKFHVVKLVMKALDRVRVDFKNTLPKGMKGQLYNDKWLLQMNKEDLEELDIQRRIEAEMKGKKHDSLIAKRDYWFQAFPPLATAYWLKEGLRDVYTSKDRYEAFQKYYQWESSISDDMMPFKEVSNSINDCKAEVFNYFLTPVKYTNAYTESINNQIKKIEKDGIGYSFKILRAKCLYGKEANERPDFGEDPFETLYKYAPCSNNPIARLRRKFERITTFVMKLFSRKPH